MKERSIMGAVFFLWLAGALLSLGGTVFLVYVAWHFISKFW